MKRQEMAEIDKQKEKLSIIRSILILFIMTLFALIAYLFNNFEILNFYKFLIVDVAILFFGLGILFLFFKLKKELDRLKEL